MGVILTTYQLGWSSKQVYWECTVYRSPYSQQPLPHLFCSKAKCTVKNSLLHSIVLVVWEYFLIIILKRAVYNPQYKEQPVFFIQGRKSRNTCWLVLKRQVWKVVSSFWFANHISHHPAVRTYRVWPFILSGLTASEVSVKHQQGEIQTRLQTLAATCQHRQIGIGEVFWAQCCIMLLC